MKLSKCLLLIALSLSACHTQTSNTYFGDGPEHAATRACHFAAATSRGRADTTAPSRAALSVYIGWPLF